jgi:hypothetical protein
MELALRLQEAEQIASTVNLVIEVTELLLFLFLHFFLL